MYYCLYLLIYFVCVRTDNIYQLYVMMYMYNCVCLLLEIKNKTEKKIIIIYVKNNVYGKINMEKCKYVYYVDTYHIYI